VGGRTAEGCIGHLIIDGKEEEFKLHWAGEPWEYQRDSAPKIDLEPTESRDLDIAFSVIGHMTIPHSKEGEISVTKPPAYFDSSSGVEGAWIATPYVIENHGFDSSVYLGPGRHRIEIRIIPSDGEGFVMNFVIESNEDPFKLDIDNDSVKYEPFARSRARTLTGNEI